MYSKIVLFTLMLFVSSNAFAWGEEKYCQPFSESKCKKGDLILAYIRQALELCDFSEPMVTVGENNKVVCKYVGYKREKR